MARRVRYNKASLSSAIEAAMKLPIPPYFIFATYFGYEISSSPPPFGQYYVKVNTDGSVERYVKHFDNPTRRTSSGWHWGSRGPFPTREKALSVMRAAYARGYRGRNPTLFDTPIMGARVSTPSGRTGTVQSVRGDKVKVKWGKASVWYPKAQFMMIMNGRNPLFGSDAENLYQSFHEAKPNRRKVKYQPPGKELVALGTVTRIDYRPKAPSRHAGTEFYHTMGDTGDQKLPSNLIIATSPDGKHFYPIKDKDGKYPHFSNRGIIG